MRLRLIASVCALAALLASCNRNVDPWHDGSPLRGVISLDGNEGGTELRVGYNYDLIKRFAKSSGRDALLRLPKPKEDILGALRTGSLDIVALPWCDSLAQDSTLVCIPADSCGLWVFPAARRIEAEKACEWFRDYRADSMYRIVRQPYFDLYNPMTRVSADFISPYDSLIRVYADTLGWDWKLLAAVLYQESKFRIEAQSSRGAGGLMQLMPDTAHHFGCDNIIDPEENIRAGVGMLLAVRKRYEGIAANRDELTKFTLAGYNAGTGRLKDCLNHARHLGLDVSKWDNVASVIPEMQHDSIASLDHIKHGTFDGGSETVYYVRRVRTYHDRYRHICK